MFLITINITVCHSLCHSGFKKKALHFRGRLTATDLHRSDPDETRTRDPKRDSDTLNTLFFYLLTPSSIGLKVR